MTLCEVNIWNMIRPENKRAIATLTPKAQSSLDFIKEELDLKDSGAICYALIFYAEQLRRSKM